MTGYPYTGGMYGGYSDPDNNKKKPFIGPEADQAVKDVGRSMLSQTSPFEAGAAAGMQSGNPLARTAKGYPHIGLSTPPRPASNREMVLNIPGDNGLQAQAASKARSDLNGDWQTKIFAPSQNPAVTRLNRPAPSFSIGNTRPGNPVTQLDNGMTLQHDREGNPTYTMGVKGQDGYGKMTVQRGTATPPAGSLSRQSLSSGAPTGRFNRPVGGPGPVPTGRMLDPVSPDYSFLKGDENSGAPKYLGPESGLGWKTRLGLYKEQMEEYRQRTGQNAAMNLEAMREAGAGERARLSAKGVNDANEIARQRLAGELKTNAIENQGRLIDQQGKSMDIAGRQRLDALQQQYLGEKDPEKQKAHGRQLLTMQGKDANKPTYQTIKEDDGVGGQRERVYRMNGDGSMSEVMPTVTPADIVRQKILLQGMKGDEQKRHLQDLARWNPGLFDALRASMQRGQQTHKANPLGGGAQRRIEAPPAAIEDLKKNPELKGQFLEKFGYLP